jgi:hypothetical protein
MVATEHGRVVQYFSRVVIDEAYMRTLLNPIRTVRLMRAVIKDLNIDLTGMNVLTEAASGPFVVTPVLAAMAGANKVVAVGRSSVWGGYDEVRSQLMMIAHEAGCADVINVTDQPAIEYATGMHIVTNLGFVRPINAALVERLPLDSAVPLMWEPWEYRPEDVDLTACQAKGIPVLGTNEGHPRLAIFAYLARVVERLLFERDIEVQGSRLLLIASAPFGPAIEEGLRRSGADVVRLDPTDSNSWVQESISLMSQIDALIVAEHRSREVIIGPNRLPAQVLVDAGVELIHLSGTIDEAELVAAKLYKHPPRQVPHGVMTVTTDYVGPRPVIDLHAAGLAVGANLVRLLRSGMSAEQAKASVVAAGLGADFPDQNATSQA